MLSSVIQKTAGSQQSVRVTDADACCVLSAGIQSPLTESATRSAKSVVSMDGCKILPATDTGPLTRWSALLSRTNELLILPPTRLNRR